MFNKDSLETFLRWETEERDELKCCPRKYKEFEEIVEKMEKMLVKGKAILSCPWMYLLNVFFLRLNSDQLVGIMDTWVSTRDTTDRLKLSTNLFYCPWQH